MNRLSYYTENADYILTEDPTMEDSYSVTRFTLGSEACGGCENAYHEECGGELLDCCCDRELVGYAGKVDGNVRKWTFDIVVKPTNGLREHVDGETFRSAKQAVETFDAHYRRNGAAVGGSRKHLPRRGGSTIIPGYTLKQAWEEAAPAIAELVATRAQEVDNPDVKAIVEEITVLEPDDNHPLLVQELGRVLSEYLAQSRQDRYNLILTRINQAVGRVLESDGLNRTTGLPKGGE